MCGIAGIWNFRGSVDPALLVAMRDRMVHRGPDGSGAWVSPSRAVGLAHRRLSIIDLSEAAAQPMQSADGTLCIVYNGEVYNHLELRRELEQAGAKFRTDHSDTETILHAYRHWGPDCVKRLRGMFAFAIWDERKKSLFMARDPFGIKPLYYSKTDAGIHFASEIKAILADSSIPRQVDETAMYDYLTFMCVPAPRTLFAGIHKLPAGHTLTLTSAGAMKVERYWDIFDDVEDLSAYSQKDYEERLLAELKNSVKVHGLADVPVGVFLSGGIDSSCNAILFNEVGGGQIKTFTVGYSQSDSYQNEFQFAQRVAKDIGSDHHEYVISPSDFINFIPELIHHQDEPIADPVCVPVYFVSKLAADNGIKVCQVGEGSDELFMGYSIWKDHYRLTSYAHNPLGRLGLTMLRAGLSTVKYNKMLHYEYVDRALKVGYSMLGSADVLPEFAKRALITPAYAKRLGGYSSYSVLDDIRRDFLKKAPESDYLKWMTYINMKLRLPELLLMRVDKMSMSVSLETRVPFLDKKFVSYVMSIPEKVLVKNLELKGLLKKSIHGILADDLIYRKKQGFGAPVRDFRKYGLGSLANEIIREFTQKTDYFIPGKMEEMVLNRSSATFWYLFNLACWHKTYILGEDLEAPIRRHLK